MRDKKFAIALGIIVVLVLALVYLLFVGPGITGYVVDKQVQAQQVVVEAIIQQVNAQGYVQLSNGNESVVLVEYVPPQEQVPQGQVQQGQEQVVAG